jgi:glycosyltransferase involved in cell wall biosynthesis
MSRYLRVAHVVLSLDPGGLERLVLLLVREGHQLGQQVAVITLERPGALAAQVEAAGAALVSLAKPPGVRLGAIGQLRTVLATLRPDVVHTHQIGALFYTGPAAHLAGVPVVVHTEHGKHFPCRLRTRWLCRLAGRYAARFFCVSEEIAADVKAYRVAPAGRVHVLPNGIDPAPLRAHQDLTALRQTLGIPAASPVVGTVGRLSEVKQHDLLLRGFARLRNFLEDAHLLVVGDGPLLGSLRELAAMLRLERAVHFVGYQAEPGPYLHIMDVFALTSRSEGMPLAVLEAWAAGVPVVATSVGGLPQMIEEGQTGLLVPSGDEEELANRLGEVLTDYDLACRLSAEGLQQVEARYHVAGVAGDYQRHYLELLAAKRVLV